MAIECRNCKKTYEIIDTTNNLNNVSECPNCGFGNKGCINCNSQKSLEGTYDGYFAFSGAPEIEKSISIEGNVIIKEIPTINIMGKTDFYVCKACIDDKIFSAIPGIIFFSIIGIGLFFLSIFSFIGSLGIFLGLFFLLLGAGDVYMLISGVLEMRDSMNNKGNNRKNHAYDIAKKYNIISPEMVKNIKYPNSEKYEEIQNTMIEKIEIDNVYKETWVCGRCQTSNHIDLDNCNSCGKEFNPPL